MYFCSNVFLQTARLVLLWLGLLLPVGAAQADAGFTRWIADFRSTAQSQGISRATYERAFAGISAPDPVVLEKARSQPEFSDAAWTYFDSRIHEVSVATGREMARKYRSWLDRIERRFGVDRHILLAIWSMESSYGEIFKKQQSLHNIFRALATLAYADKRRAKFARQQLIAALRIAQQGHIDARHMTGSWAGAMGHTQFIPTSYLAYAVDMDGDGRADIWNSVPDALATAANLLARNGWQSGQTWGYEVTIPSGRKFPAGNLSLARWQEMGVRRANGKGFPRGSDQAELKVPDGRTGPIFLVIRNFHVLKRYNNADRYALAVGLLADEIAGHGGLTADWNRPFTKLSFQEKQELQKRLLALGYYEGEIDGWIGSGSRAAIMAFQKRAGMTPDGHPSKEVLMRLRGR